MELALHLAAIAILLAALLTAFSIRLGASVATITYFALMVYGDALFLLGGTAPSVLSQAGSLSGMVIYGPATWWLVRTQISGANGFMPWGFPAVGLAFFALNAFEPAFFFLPSLIAAAFFWASFNGYTVYLLWKNRYALAAQAKFIWLFCIVLAGLWVATTNLIIPLLPEHPIDAFWGTSNAFVVTGITIALLWWALVQPSVYLENSRNELTEKSKTFSDFDQAIFSQLEATFETERIFTQQDLSLRSLADQFAVTPRELSNAINRCAGINFRSHLRTHRIEYAKALLTDQKNSNRSIIQIAAKAGFATKSTFNDAFKTEVGITPSDYREQNCR